MAPKGDEESGVRARNAETRETSLSVSDSQDTESVKGRDGKEPSTSEEIHRYLTQAKVLAMELSSKYQHNPEFRQQVNIYLMMGVSGVILLLWLMQDGDSESMALSTDGMAAGAASVATKVVLTKRQREDHEGIDDLDTRKDLHSVKRRFGNREEIEAAMERERKSHTKKSCFRFPVQISRDSSELTYYTPKKVFDLPVLVRPLQRKGFVPETDMKKATLVLKGLPRITFRQLRQGKMYYDMVGSLERIGSEKKTQLATLRNYVRKFKCTFESLHLQPRSYDMSKSAECKRFFEHKDKGKMWVFKSCNSGEGSKGLGISVTDDLSEKRSEYGTCEPGAFNYVAQAYIEHPLLLHNSKFDMRAYLFVASTKPYIVFFNPGYIRRSLAKYNPKSTKKDDVLTNYHVQMNRGDFTPDDAMWSFENFIKYLYDEGLCRACGDIQIKLASIGRMVFDSGRAYYKRFPGSFQIVGLDFMMDEYLNVMFIEGNVSPGLGSHGLSWKKKLMDDLVYLMYDQSQLIAERPDEFTLRIGERVYGPNDYYWELVVHEQHEKCDKQYEFDPCKELAPEYGSVAFDEVQEVMKDAAAVSESASSGGADDDDEDS